MYSREYIFEAISKICDRFGFIPYECFDIDRMILKIKIEDQQGNKIDVIKIDPCSFNENTLDKLYDKLLNAVPNEPAEKHIVDWRPISEYSRDKYDWVLVKYFDGAYECVPEVAADFIYDDTEITISLGKRGNEKVVTLNMCPECTEKLLELLDKHFPRLNLEDEL